ncbi:hypothetical protein RhiirA1_402293 [Rhizophagus irregularis]|uniref:Uncharacterized protein n=2 Tax=Rhizophagus irregularis TaxID=588596 RepID=A0A2I1END2_9GLOM|nr:hypothetical protein GLOIN_2v1877541 [Rhizophagus irregularis DAOM 181602=DAOM 197198]PKC56226.1 hypothetical protein RhiirA1_402293 [Rhizophagus irregularis]PKY23641.1 hypothetical protein RhiirB3_437905 [Rhizophagus irregularis]POG69459.1 hypothetical protein GLOIN_2v1877541 [Rhizophagus irregularis DAOM 181602=DAOM 197198]UZO20248.1 hypothetical protein OCT59_012674 [Rhizophagus irregularis]CAB5215565.1 unnamed protein product [Rhizophagus irregularis]|eukprot:XP_025176325.1 hypothetical protein GLOIN_2v1877541 [Rhizophagus irregularis DAOM 181602=DAOM 197198]
MYALLAAESEDIINKLFNNIQMADENTSDWIEFYRQKWVIASLNKWDARKIARSVQSNKRKGNNITYQNTRNKSFKEKEQKTIAIDTDVEEDCCEDDNYEKNNHNKENELTLRVKELEYRENDLASKEREIVLREREAKFVKWNYIIVKKSVN